MEQKLQEAYDYIKKTTTYTPTIGIILGSGLGKITPLIENAEIYSYKEIPNFPTSSVEGHKNRLIIGELGGKTILAMDGRFHYYEGYSMQEVTFPIKVMKLLGVKTLLVSNAAGGINSSFQPGNFMIISDHINLYGNNPLIGKNDDDFGPRFPDMSNAYNKELIQKAKSVAHSLNIDIKEGVYVMTSGPNYETPAEVRMIRAIGGDAVGMSTVPEVIVANHCGINVLGISCISNMAAGISNNKLNHQEVIETSNMVKNDFISLIKNLIKEL